MLNRTVLLIDDSNVDRFIICEFLKNAEGCRYEFLEVSNSDTALKLLDEIIPDCILLDNYMLGNGMDGVDLVPFIQKTQNKFTPIIMITGIPSKEIEEKALGAGVAYYLEKTNLDPKILHDHISFAIKKNSELRAMVV